MREPITLTMIKAKLEKKRRKKHPTLGLLKKTAQELMDETWKKEKKVIPKQTKRPLVTKEAKEGFTGKSRYRRIRDADN